ncbi:MAG: phage tail protein [Burkholderiaceae bacterium]|jgi:hypothetical protein|nr:phage tail protein [Burkholderiaceae bacterium]
MAGFTDVRDNIADLRDRIQRFSESMRGKIISRALNRTAIAARTMAAQEIRRTYSISSRVIRHSISVNRANSGRLYATVRADGGPLPVYGFSPKQTKQGVMAKIKGRRVLFPRAFIARMKSGHVGVFARGGYKGDFEWSGKAFGRFRFGKGRYSVNEFYTASVPQGFSNTEVKNKVLARIHE